MRINVPDFGINKIIVMENTLFQDIPDNCFCNSGNDNGCMCSHAEQVVRRYASGEELREMTNEEKEYCISQAIWAGEGSYKRKELEEMNNKDLAYCTLRAWLDYASSMY